MNMQLLIHRRKTRSGASVSLKNHIARWVLLTLSLALSITCFLNPVAAETRDETLSYYFTDPEGTDTVMPQGEVVAGLLGGIPASEIDYLNNHSRYVLYTAAIPRDKTYAHVSGDGVLVLAYDYVYTTTDGITVMWMPLLAENTETGEITDMSYDSDLELYRGYLAGEEDQSIKVYFAASFTLSEDVALEMVNEAHKAAVSLMAAMEFYETALGLWTPQKEAYDAYLSAYDAWVTATKAYEDYLKEKAVYDAWWEDHDAKEAAMNAYLEQKAAYEAWTKYQSDLEAYEAYMALVNASPELKAQYEADMAIVLSQLAVMDRMFIKSHISGYSFEGVLNSGAVDYILNNKDELLNVPDIQNKEDVYTSVDATRALRKLVDAYKALTSREEQYEFYIANRDEMTTWMKALYRSMVALGEVEFVYDTLQSKGALDTYLQFLGNLYVQGWLMDDAATLDIDTAIFGRNLTELVESELILEDKNQMAPLEAYPHPPQTSDDVPEVPYPGDPPAEAEHPGEMPDEVPDTYYAPDLPAEISPAGDAPEVVEDPGEAPSAPEMTEAEKGLYDAYVAGEITARDADALPEGGTFSTLMSGETRVVSGKTVKINFYTHAGDLISGKRLIFGSSLLDNQNVKLPKVYAENGALLTFVGWSLTPMPLPQSVEDVYPVLETTEVVKELSLYPVYRLYHTSANKATCTEAEVCKYCNAVLTPALGHTEEEIPAVAPTCTETGLTAGVKCSVCKEILIAQEEVAAKGHTPGDEATCTTAQICTECTAVVKPAMGHEWDEGKITTEPGCETDGERTYTCRHDETHTRTEPVPAFGHTEAEAIEENRIEAKCEEDGSYDSVVYCSDCSKELRRKVQTIPALGHEWDEGTMTTKPSCETQGEKTYTCQHDETHTYTEPVDPVGHTEAEAIEENRIEAKCEEDGSYDSVVYCSDCSKELRREVQTIPAPGHEWDEGEVTTAPTCTESGIRTHGCIRCVATKTTVEDALDHDMIYETEVNPTCTTPGQAAGSSCSRCDFYMGEGEIPALGHDWDEGVVDVAPTCTEEGSLKYTCERENCGEIKTQVLSAVGHTEEEIPAVASTCTETGLTAGVKCSVCGEVLVAQIKVDALGHSYETEETEPTCTEDGYTTYTCSRCEDTYIADEIEAAGHDYESVVTEPTCTKDGYTTYTCSVCHDAYVGDETEATGHDYESVVTEPTCTENGYTTYTCAVCQDNYISDEVAAEGHDYESVVIPPTCTEDGYTTYTCPKCEDTYIADEIEAAGHDSESVVTEPTCTENGYTTHTCSVCYDTYTDHKVEAEGHTPNGDATCTQDSVCTVCDRLLAEKTGHHYKHTVTRPTCVEEGYTTHTCTRCGDSYRDSETQAVGHIYGSWIVDVQPAPEVEGHRYAECKTCGYRSEETLPALPPVETTPDTEPDTEEPTDTEEPSETEEPTDTVEPDTEESTEPVTDPETDTQPIPETERDTMPESERPTEPETRSEETVTLPGIDIPEVKWYARLLGAVGLPGLAIISGGFLGGAASGIAILIMKTLRKKRLKK